MGFRMHSQERRLREILGRDIDPEFLVDSAVSLAWEYDRLYDEVAQDDSVDSHHKFEAFNRRRGAQAERSLIYACKKNRVPSDYRTLESNGHKRLFVKSGRVTIMQESLLTFNAPPKPAVFKFALAEANSIIRQLELDLGDQPRRILDWGGEVFAVLLHGACGPRFTEESCKLGGLFLAVPLPDYSGWIARLSLRDMALHGSRVVEHQHIVEEEVVIQRDCIAATLKKQYTADEDGAA